ncbi:MAG: NUDIX domain-containing protein [Deltaproteobacteria bacterium]|nr:NUDIX domain-containing protein [Deltaproteobacteria bacterium]
MSAGALVWRRGADGIEVLIVHPGGPFFAKKDEGAWSIPKGEIEDGDDPLETAARELHEETGLHPETPFESLGAIRQKSGKTVHAFAVDGAGCEVPRGFRPPQVRIEWPPGSMRELAFDEVDRVEWHPLDVARKKLNPAQVELVDRLVAHLADATTERQDT